MLVVRLMCWSAAWLLLLNILILLLLCFFNFFVPHSFFIWQRQLARCFQTPNSSESREHIAHTPRMPRNELMYGGEGILFGKYLAWLGIDKALALASPRRHTPYRRAEGRREGERELPIASGHRWKDATIAAGRETRQLLSPLPSPSLSVGLFICLPWEPKHTVRYRKSIDSLRYCFTIAWKLKTCWKKSEREATSKKSQHQLRCSWRLVTPDAKDTLIASIWIHTHTDAHAHTNPLTLSYIMRANISSGAPLWICLLLSHFSDLQSYQFSLLFCLIRGHMGTALSSRWSVQSTLREA